MRKFNGVLLTALSVLAGACSVSAQTNVAPAGLGPVYSLDQFGPVTSPDQAEATFQQATKDIMATGGGVIVIPAQAPAAWRPLNTTQEEVRKPAPPAPARSWAPGPAVTVLDARGGTVKVLPPQVTGLELNRVLDMPQGQSLPFWGYFPMVSMRNTILHGSTSYRDWLQEEVEPGKDRRFYVPTIRGIFPGMFMSIGEYGVVQRLYVKSLGYDQEKQMWYFVADADAEVPKGALMGNKNHVNVLKMETFSHNENQTFDVMLWRHNYSQGDNYLVDARFKYMSDVHSTAGDENGVIYAAFVESDSNIFRARVEKWNPETGELKFQPADGRTLGSGRPIINLNPGKWITQGTVLIVRPGGWDTTPEIEEPVFEGQTRPATLQPDRVGVTALRMGGLIRFSADAPLTKDVVGRYFAVDEPGEYVPQAQRVRRWYLIDSLTQNPDGTKEIRIVRHWWGAKSAGAPRLYKPENYTADGHLRPLKYIIAPGANAYDVSEGVDNPRRTIRLAPTPFTGTAADFAANDPVEQAIGPDPFKPIPFRSWLWDRVPGAFPSPVFDIANHGPVRRDAVLSVRGGSGELALDQHDRYDCSPPWDQIISVNSACETAVRFGGDTGNAALLFAQPHNRVQPIKWFYGTETNQPAKVASLTVSRETGEFNFTGGGLLVNGMPIGGAPARNQRGMDLPVKAGENRINVTFPVAEPDGKYAVFIEQNWISNRAIVKKDARGFSVQFDSPAPADASLDWMIVR